MSHSNLWHSVGLDRPTCANTPSCLAVARCRLALLFQVRISALDFLRAVAHSLALVVRRALALALFLALARALAFDLRLVWPVGLDLALCLTRTGLDRFDPAGTPFWLKSTVSVRPRL